MNIQELKLKSSEQLITQAEELGIENASTLRKQEILFAILKKVAEKEEITGAGVLQLLQEGFGFLRAMESNYLPGPDDIYVSPSQIRKFGLRTGDTVEGPVRAPKEGKKNVLAICPGFSSDCVETLEEIQIQGKESFLESGGENFDMVPCLNDNDDHIILLKSLIQKNI